MSDNDHELSEVPRLVLHVLCGEEREEERERERERERCDRVTKLKHQEPSLLPWGKRRALQNHQDVIENNNSHCPPFPKGINGQLCVGRSPRSKSPFNTTKNKWRQIIYIVYIYIYIYIYIYMYCMHTYKKMHVDGIP